MKRFLIVTSILTLLSVGALGCQKKAAEDTDKTVDEGEKTEESQTATQKASIEIEEGDN